MKTLQVGQILKEPGSHKFYSLNQVDGIFQLIDDYGTAHYQATSLEKMTALVEHYGLQTETLDGETAMTESTKQEYLNQVLPERKSLGYTNSNLYYDRFTKKVYHFCDFDQEIKQIDNKTVLKLYSHQLDSSEIAFLSKGIFKLEVPNLNFWLVNFSRYYLMCCSIGLVVALAASHTIKDAERPDFLVSTLILLSLPTAIVSCAKADYDS